MPDLLLELRTEEIPARMQGRAAEHLARLLEERLGAVDLKPAAVETFVTPRRLAAVVRELPEAQPDRSEERRGPRVGAPDKAVQGFVKSTGMTLDECEQRETPKGTFYFAVKQITGRPTAEVLPELIADVILALPWPKSMRWGDMAARFVRPLHGIVALLDGEPLSGGLHLGGDPDGDPPRFAGEATACSLSFGRMTRGHRFLSSGDIAVSGADEYAALLQEGHVMVDAAERRERIRADAARLAEAEGLTVKADEGLVDECAGLVEWPVVMVGAIDQEFMDVPPEVLTTAMRAHQKYFSVVDANGALAPRFIVVANMVALDGGEEIVRGNERVLRARLADAKFFWDQDRKRPLASRVADLSQIIFQARLGTVADKVVRLQELAASLVAAGLAAEPLVPGAAADDARRAAELCKADLTTEMVFEFPELQGIMGRYYALHDGESPAVADAVAEHYSPQGPGDRCPTAALSVAVALADKIDSLVGFFAIDEKPTGSKDPYALRRAALGVIRLVVENGLRAPLRAVFEKALDGYPDGLCGRGAATLADELLEFFADRLKVHLRERGVRHDLVSAIFALGGEDDLVRLLARVEALEGFLASEDGANLLIAYRRASNIVRIEEKKDGTSYAGAADAARLQQDEEKALFEALADVDGRATPALEREAFTDAMAALADLRRPVDAFFDEVTVNCDDSGLRRNRLLLLSQIRGTLERVADFSQIEG